MNPSQDPQSSNDATNLSIRSGAKILVSGLPPDVTEEQLRELFEQTVSNVRRVELAFNQSGVSKGMALIEFISSDSGLDAHQQFHGKIIDGASILNVELVSIPIVETMKFTPLHPLNVSNVNHTQPNQAQSTSAQNKVKKPHVKAQRPASALSLKQRLALPKPTPPPKRYLFKTPVNTFKSKKQRSSVNNRPKILFAT